MVYGSVKISNLDNGSVWEKSFGQGVFNQFKECVDNHGKSTVWLLPATFMPVRTNNWDNFSKDFFLPTTVNHAMKVQNTVGKIFAILAALVLDAVTFPIRLLTCIPRVISNAIERKVLLEYLRAEGVNKEILESDRIRVRFEWKHRSQTPTSSTTDENGIRTLNYKVENRFREEVINLIEVPIYKEKDSDYFAGGTY